MYVGGMGSATHNYHRDAMARRGFPEAAARIQELWLAGRKEEAIAAVPDEYLEQSHARRHAEQRIRDRWERGFADSGATGVIVRAEQTEALELVAELAGTRDTAGGELMSGTSTYELILVDTPAEHVRRITLNRPEKRNAISTPLRVELLDALRAHDNDPDVRVTIVRGAGPCFSAGYDLGGGPLMEDAPFYSAPGDGQWARQANDTWFSIWDLAKPVIAQIHGYAIAGGTELASACDLVYVADDAQISYPVVRVREPARLAVPHRAARHAPRDGAHADRRLRSPASRPPPIGFANRAFPADRARRRGAARRRAGSPACRATSRRSTSAACTGPFDVWGARAAIRAGTELQALAGSPGVGAEGEGRPPRRDEAGVRPAAGRR